MHGSPLHRFYGPPSKPAIPVRPSKHAAAPGDGRAALTVHSSLRKLARVMRRRGDVPAWLRWPSQRELLSHDWYRKLVTTAEAQNAEVA